jgi:hypothetical protein
MGMSSSDELRKRKAKRRARLKAMLDAKNSVQSPKLHDLDGQPEPMWMDEQGIHAILPGDKPDAETLERMTIAFQQKIRNSPMFAEMVKTYGQAKAEELLSQCRAQCP